MLGLLPGIGLLLLAIAVNVLEPIQASMMRRSGASTASEALRALANAPIHFVQAATQRTPPFQLAINIKFKHLHKMHERRAEALETGSLEPTPDDFVAAEINFAAQAIAVKMRLAEGSAKFLERGKWPLEVRIRGEGHIFGMRRFVLRPPEQRGFQTESLFLSHLRRYDVLAPRFHFVDVSINGKDIGLMAIEEFFSREMLENQQRRDGPILRLRPAASVAGQASSPLADPLRFDPAIQPMRPREIEKSKRLTRSLELANGMLRAFMAGKLSAWDVFDLTLTAHFLAIAELWGARHALEWQSLRFYFNPLTARLEPVGYAAQIHLIDQGDQPILTDEPFIVHLLADDRLRSAVRKALHEIGEEMQTDAFAADLEQQQSWILGQLHREYPMRLAFELGPLLERIESLERLDWLPEIQSSEQRLPAKQGRLTPLPQVAVANLLSQHPFLRWNEATNYFHATAGHWKVEGSLILPEGAGLELVAGTTLHFERGQGIIARGPLRFLGSEAAPIVLEGPASREKSRLWAGIYVIESARESHWSHVTVRGTGGFKRGGWRLAGGVVFRKTRVVIDHCTFHRSLTDDSLNIIRSEFLLRDVKIDDAYSDAFDGDYVTGSIQASFFSQAGGDGVDLGGSVVKIEASRFRNIRDKALAVGEQSHVEASGLDIDTAGIAVASKNGATTLIENSTIRGITDVAFVAYMNRAQFGPGQLTVLDTRIEDTRRTAVAQIGSEVSIDGLKIPPVDAAIDLLHKDSDLDLRGAH